MICHPAAAWSGFLTPGPLSSDQRISRKDRAMGKAIRCKECGKVYRDLDELEDLRDNDSVCLVCNATIEVGDWDRVLASYEEDEEDLDDIDEEDWEEDEGDFDEEEEELDEDVEEDEDFEPDLDEEEEEEDEEIDDEEEEEY